MALNALQSDMVRFTGTPGVEVNGIIVGYRAEYTPRTSTDPKYNRLIDNKHSSNIDYSGQYYVQLGEELYNGELTKRYVTDDFERPSFNWQFKGKEIGTYVNYTLREAVYTEAVKYSELYDLLTYTTIDENDLDRFKDGVDQNEVKSNFARSNKKEIGDQGVLTEVFVDRDRNQITITEINTYLAQANSDYNTTNETLSLKVYETSATGVTKIVDVKDVPKIEGVKKDEYKLVYLSGKDNNSATNKVVANIFDTEILAQSSITKWSNATAPKVVDKLTTGGTEYKSNPKAFYDDGNVLDNYNLQLLTDNTYNIYLDRYGNVIGVDLYEGTKNYVFITGYDRGRSNISVKTADAAAIFLDGTMDVISVNVTDTDKNIDAADGTSNNVDGHPYFKFWSSASNVANGGKRNENRWYTYTVNNNGVYTLTPATRMFATDYDYSSLSDGTKVLDCANLYVQDNGTDAWNGGTKISPVGTNTRAYGEDASIYITVDTDRVDTSVDPTDAITDVNGVYTGIQDVKLELKRDTQNTVPNAVYTVYDNDNYIIASIVLGEAQGATGSYGYILGGAKSERIERESSTRAAGDVTYYWEFDAVYNGEKTTLTAKTKYPSSQLLHPYNVQELRFDGEYVTDLKDVPLSRLHTSNQSNNNIENMYVYDVGQVVGPNWTDNNTGALDNTNAMPNGNGGTVGRIDDTLDLQGRTLKTKAGSEVALALARDAKAVTVQMEDGKRVVTNHSSVSDAISRLADRRDNIDGVQFKGRIVAVLDSRGVAQWVVFISDTELLTGNNPNYGNGGGNLNVALKGGAKGDVVYSVSETGMMRATITYTAPDFAAPGATVYMPAIDVYNGSRYIGTIPADSENLVNGKATFTYTSSRFDYYGENTANLTFKLTASETLSAVKVVYVVKDATGKTLDNFFVAANTRTQLKTTTDNLYIELDDAKYTSANTASLKTDGLVSDLNEASVDLTAAVGGTAPFANVVAAGTKAVTVTITVATQAPATYSITAPAGKSDVLDTSAGVLLSSLGLADTDANASKKLIISAKTGAIADNPNGTLVALQAKLDGAQAADATLYKLKVTVKVAGKTLTALLNGNTNVDLTPASGSASILMTRDYQIESITVERIDALKVVSVTKTGLGTYAIKFNMNVVGTETDPAGAFKTGDVTFEAAGSATGTAILNGSISGDTVTIETVNSNVMTDLVATEGFKIVSIKSKDNTSNVIDGTSGLNTWKLNATADKFEGSHT